MRHLSVKRIANAYLGDSAVMQDLLGLAHALYWQHFTLHWQSQGDLFYSSHLLFERLYKVLPEEIDTLAEKMVHLYGKDSVAIDVHLPIMSKWLSEWSGISNPYSKAYKAEMDFQRVLKETHESLGKLSLGLDDFLMSVANDHETHLYLLQQQLGGKQASEAPSEEARFFDAPRKREPREFALSEALTNVPDVSKQVSYSNGPVQKVERKRLNMSPLTPLEVVKNSPGSDEFSTLSRYLVKTKHPTDANVPKSHADIPKHPDIKGGF